MLADAFDFFVQLWAMAGAALRLSPDVLARAAAASNGDLLIAAMTVLAGGSLLAGQSVTLFVNRVKPGGFAFSLLFYGIVFALSLALWAMMVWLCAVVLFAARQPLVGVLRIVGLSSAPLLFGFLIFLPYLGAPIDWALRTWSALILLVMVRASFHFSAWAVVVCATLGWLLAQAGTRLLGDRLSAVRDWLWRVATGTQFDTNEQELIAAATDALRAQLAAWEAQRVSKGAALTRSHPE